MEYIKEFIKHKESKGEKAIYRVNDTRGYTYYSDDYVMWLEQQLCIHDVSGSCEQPQSNNGDLVPLIWMIEELRRREGGCTMNELIAEAKRNFKGVEQIKHRTINYR